MTSAHDFLLSQKNKGIAWNLENCHHANNKRNEILNFSYITAYNSGIGTACSQSKAY